MSQTKARRKTPLAPHGGDDLPLPAWLQLPSFTDDERKLYLEAADRCALDVTHWARQVLTGTAHSVLGTASRQSRRAPPSLALVPRRGGRA